MAWLRGRGAGLGWLLHRPSQRGTPAQQRGPCAAVQGPAWLRDGAEHLRRPCWCRRDPVAPENPGERGPTRKTGSGEPKSTPPSVLGTWVDSGARTPA